MRLSDLSAARVALVRLCQSIDYGRIEGLQVSNKEPVFDPQPLVLIDVKLNSAGGPRRETLLEEFELCDEVCGLIQQLDRLGSGRVDRIEIRDGIPRRILIEAKLIGAWQ